MKNCGELIKKYRKRKELTQGQLSAELALGLGLRQTVNNIERGGSASLRLIMIVGSYLEIPAAEIKKAYISDIESKINNQFEQLKKQFRMN